MKFCYPCRKLKYPRFYHCKYCSTCVFKLDHHCFFINNCVGSHNLGSFIQMLFYVSLCLLVSIIHHLYWIVLDISYKIKTKGDSKGTPPNISLNVITYIHFFFNIGIFVSTSLLCCFQWYLAYHNLSSLEYRNILMKSQTPFKQSFKETVKGNWYINIFPTV